MAKSKEKQEEKALKAEMQKSGMGVTRTLDDFAQLSKYFCGEQAQLNRSDIRFAEYNPRVIDEEHLKTLKRGIRKYGLVGGIVVNKQTGNTLVSGHQRLTVMDELQKYDPDTHGNDYSIRCDLIDVDEKTEKELVIFLNNPNAQGKWDYDRLRELMPQVDYKDVGFTDADLSMIGVDFMMPTVGDPNAAAAITQMIMPELTAPVSQAAPAAPIAQVPAGESPASYEEKVQHMKDVKAQVKEQAMQRAADNTAYIMLSFDNYANLQDFLAWLDLSPDTQIIKGEEFATMFQDMGEDEDE
ncbi:MAG: ParB N-terminal domain-containing protein [Prevotella sp.]|nr:ParB N-terminal domain-containing protein [Prevotella sp.]